MILGGSSHLYPWKNDYAKFVNLYGIFGRFGAPGGAPGVTNRWYTTPGECQGRTNQKHLYFDGFYEAVPRFTLEKKGLSQI